MNRTPQQRVLAGALLRAARTRGMMFERVQGDAPPAGERKEKDPPTDQPAPEKEDFGMR